MFCVADMTSGNIWYTKTDTLTFYFTSGAKQRGEDFLSRHSEDGSTGCNEKDIYIYFFYIV